MTDGEIERAHSALANRRLGRGTAAYPQSQPHGCCESKHLGPRTIRTRQTIVPCGQALPESFSGILPGARHDKPHNQEHCVQSCVFDEIRRAVVGIEAPAHIRVWIKCDRSRWLAATPPIHPHPVPARGCIVLPTIAPIPRRRVGHSSDLSFPEFSWNRRMEKD